MLKGGLDKSFLGKIGWLVSVNVGTYWKNQYEYDIGPIGNTKNVEGNLDQ